MLRGPCHASHDNRYKQLGGGDGYDEGHAGKAY